MTTQAKVKRWPCPTHGELEWEGTVACACGRFYRFVLRDGTADQFDVTDIHGDTLPGPISVCPCSRRFEPGSIKPTCGQCFEEAADITRKGAN